MLVDLVDVGRNFAHYLGTKLHYFDHLMKMIKNNKNKRSGRNYLDQDEGGKRRSFAKMPPFYCF